MKKYYTYILANQKNGTLYVGVTNNLFRRVWEHKNKMIKGFTKKYGINKLVYYESYCDIRDAIYREKCMKKWNRSWKIKLIVRNNPNWNDLFLQLYPDGFPPTRE